MTIKQWKNLPAMLAGVAMLIIFAGAVLTHVGRRIGIIDPHVRIIGDATPTGASERAVIRALTPPALDGEVTRTAERLRELSGVTTALVLYATGERLRGRTPATVSELLAGVERQGLMPPGVMVQDQPGYLTVTHRAGASGRAAHGDLFVRYRPQPLGIEVVATGREGRDGPALMMRVPEAASDEGASYFVATGIEEVQIPAAFAAASEVIAQGWTRATLRAVAVPSGERQGLREWAGKRAS